MTQQTKQHWDDHSLLVAILKELEDLNHSLTPVHPDVPVIKETPATPTLKQSPAVSIKKK